jgi:hypothetical protein
MSTVLKTYKEDGVLHPALRRAPIPPPLRVFFFFLVSFLSNPAEEALLGAGSFDPWINLVKQP